MCCPCVTPANTLLSLTSSVGFEHRYTRSLAPKAEAQNWCRSRRSIKTLPEWKNSKVPHRALKSTSLNTFRTNRIADRVHQQCFTNPPVLYRVSCVKRMVFMTFDSIHRADELLFSSANTLHTFCNSGGNVVQ